MKPRLAIVRTAVRHRAVASVLLVGVLFAVMWALPVPASGASGAETGKTGDPAAIVERWRGTIQRQDTLYPAFCDTDGYITRSQFDYDLTVDDTRAVHGTVKVTLLDFTHTLDGYCLGLIATSQRVLQPVAIAQVEGVRYTAANGQPALKLTQATYVQRAQYQDDACAIVPPLITDPFCFTHVITWPTPPGNPYLTNIEYLIQTPGQNRPPLARLAAPDLSAGGISIRRQGYLVGEGERPDLSLDAELSERGVFYQQVPVTNRYDATVTWNALDGGYLTWLLGTQTRRDPLSGNTLATDFANDVRVDALPGGATYLNAQATTALGFSSRPETATIHVTPPPAWAGPPSGISATKSAGAVHYRWQQNVPQPPFEARATVPDGVPFFGGKAIGLIQVNVPSQAEVLSTGEGSLNGYNQAGFEALNGLTGGEGRVTGQVTLVPTGTDVRNGRLDIKTTGTLQGLEPILRLIPPLRGAIGLLSSVWPGGAQALLDATTVRLPLFVDLNIPFAFKNVGDRLALESRDWKAGPEFREAFSFAPVKNWVAIDVGLGGRATVTGHVPAPYFQQAAASFGAWARAALFTYSTCVGTAWQFTVPPPAFGSADAACGSFAASSSGAAGAVGSGSTHWLPLDRSYLDHSPYARWTARETLPSASPSSSGAGTVAATATPTQDLKLVENVFPQAKPSLAASSAFRLLAWAHDQPGKPLLAGQDLAFTSTCGGCTGDWQPWALATHDDRADLAPQVAIVDAVNGVAVWQRFDAAAPPDFDTDPPGYLSHVQVAASWRNFSGSDPWAPPVQLSTGGSLNARPQVAAMAGGALAVWVHNSANQLFGDAGHPDSLQFSHLDLASHTWTPAAPVVANLAGLQDFSLAADGTSAALVYGLDGDGDWGTTTDRELYYTQWQGHAWTAPQRLTNNGLDDATPLLALDAAGKPELVWRQGADLKFVQGGWAEAPVDVSLPEAVAGTNLQLVRDDKGNLALVWQEVAAADTRIGYALYDASHAVWSSARTVTPPAAAGDSQPVVQNMTAVLAPSRFDATTVDSLVVAYQLADTAWVTQTVGGVTVPNVPQPGQNDLHVTAIPLQSDLSISTGDLLVTPAVSQPGDALTLAATVHNSGAWGMANIVVRLSIFQDTGRQGQPPVEIEHSDRTITLLPAGGQATLAFPITHPASGDRLFTVRIDPDHVLQELNRDNNSATVHSGLAIALTGNEDAPGGILLRAVLSQTGPFYVSQGGSAAVHLDAPDGPELTHLDFSFPITPTTAVTASTWITSERLGPGAHLAYLNLDPANALGDPNRTDNLVATVLSVAPDLTSSSALVGFGESAGSTAPFSMQVENRGNWASQGGRVRVLDAPPGQPGARELWSLPLPNLPAGGYAELSGTLNLAGSPAASGLKAVYVQLDPDQAVTELDEGNNMVLAGKITVTALPNLDRKLYLPAIRR